MYSNLFNHPCPANCSVTHVSNLFRHTCPETCSVTPVSNLFSHPCQKPVQSPLSATTVQTTMSRNPYSHLCPATPVHYPVTSVHSVQQPLSIHPVHPPLSSIAATCALHTHSHPFHSPLSSHPCPESSHPFPATSIQPSWPAIPGHLILSSRPCSNVRIAVSIHLCSATPVSSVL